MTVKSWVTWDEWITPQMKIDRYEALGDVSTSTDESS